MLTIDSLFKLAKQAENSTIYNSETEEKPVRKIVDGAGNVAGAIGAGALATVKAVKDFDKPAPVTIIK